MNSNKNKKNQHNSWKAFFKFYKNVKLPWLLYLGTFILSFGVTKVNLMLVPYTTRLYQGEIGKENFLKGFVIWTLVSAAVSLAYSVVWGFCKIISYRNTRKVLWEKILRIPVFVYDREQPQGLISRITNDVELAVNAPGCVATFFSSLYGITMAYIEMNKIYPTLAKLILYVIPVAIIVIMINGKMQFKINFVVQNAFSEITNFFGERLNNMKLIKSMSTEDEEYKKGIMASQIKYKADVLAGILFTLQLPIGYIVQYTIMVIVFLGGAYYVRSGQMKIDGLVAFYNYSMILIPSFFEIVTQWQSIKNSQGGCAKIISLMQEEEEKQEGTVSMQVPDENLAFEKVSFAYDEGSEILSDISFIVPKGKVTAIVGENGSGKTTIFKLLERYYKPKSGSLKFGSKDIANIKLNEWRDAIGYVSQNSQLISGTIRDNIAYGASNGYTEEAIIRAAKLANAYDFIQSFEKGLDTEVGEYGEKLSGGQRQRIAIARAIMKDPDYLMLDESTSSLDVVSEAEVVKGLKNLMDGRTTLMISHDMEMVKKADHIVVIKDGNVEAQGHYDDIIKTSESLKKYTMAQV
ncbi:ABC transporter ATP-binding protein [Clostridium sp. P21]|uniref:ABC transporter ATP-binding protein n=1 Tax=Clostridium muellerianum TaxID=2716538 RepID=A0A7Y0HNC4_9CLOT|nr:ABC transporter ATP-binding protein [Clostridium muellerianum]NMM63015.1 ABC transporter ATP-binding protein [Clostridium muellerianum]